MRPLYIAFIGPDHRQTRINLRQFAEDNAEQVFRFDDRAGRVFLRDGGVVEAVPEERGRLLGRVYDQVIIADDRRMLTLAKRTEALACLLHTCKRSKVPGEFIFQFYDTDAEKPQRREGATS